MSYQQFSGLKNALEKQESLCTISTEINKKTKHYYSSICSTFEQTGPQFNDTIDLSR